jgi:hypothetical protein
VGVGADDEIDKGVAGGGCGGAEVKEVAWATVTTEIGAMNPPTTLHDSSSLDPPARELLSAGSVV